MYVLPNIFCTHSGISMQFMCAIILVYHFDLPNPWVLIVWYRKFETFSSSICFFLVVICNISMILIGQILYENIVLLLDITNIWTKGNFFSHLCMILWNSHISSSRWFLGQTLMWLLNFPLSLGWRENIAAIYLRLCNPNVKTSYILIQVAYNNDTRQNDISSLN